MPGLILHSDRGSQFVSKVFVRLAKDHRVVQSMSRKDDCWDNARRVELQLHNQGGAEPGLKPSHMSERAQSCCLESPWERGR